MHIHDPSTGQTAKINDENFLFTYSVQVPEASHVSEAHGGAYAVYMKHAIQAANTTENLGLIRVPSNADREVKVQRIILSHRLAAADYIHFEAHVDPTTITNTGTLSLPINMNRGSNKASVATGHHNGSNTMVATPQANDAGEMLGISLNLYDPNIIIPYDGELVLRPGNDLLIQCKSGTQTGVEIRAVVYFFEHRIE